MPEDDGLRAAFLAALDPSRRTLFTAVTDLADQLGDFVARAMDTSSDYDVDARELVAHVARRLPSDSAPESVLVELRAGDLCLAYACASGNPRALAAFERELGGDIDHALSGHRGLGMSREEFRQRMLEKLFVAAEGSSPTIANYRGLGELRSWLRVVAVRTIVDLARKRAKHELPVEATILASFPAVDSDPELASIKRNYETEFRDAFREAFASLAARERNLLRYQVFSKLSAEDVAAAYGVHRATAFRWFEQARAQLVAGIRSALAERLDISRAQLDSIVAAAQNNLDISVRQLLDSNIEDEPGS